MSVNAAFFEGPVEDGAIAPSPPQYATEAPPLRRRFFGDTFQGILGGILASSVILGIAGQIESGDPLKVPKVAAEKIKYLFVDCEPVEAAAIQKMQDQLQADRKKARTATEKLPWRDKLAEQNGLHLADLEPFHEDRRQNPDDPTTILALVDKFTTNQYGFRTTAKPGANPEQLRQDALNVVYTLYPQPVELIKAANIKEISLNDNLKEEHDIDPDKAGAVHNPGKHLIRFKPGLVEYAMDHEVQHGLSHASDELRGCSPGEETHNFAAINPPDFTYKERKQEDTSWQGITSTNYGGTDEFEDRADMARIPMRTDPNDWKIPCDLIFSSVINKKVATTLAEYDGLVPGAGNFYSAAITTETPEC